MIWLCRPVSTVTMLAPAAVGALSYVALELAVRHVCSERLQIPVDLCICVVVKGNRKRVDNLLLRWMTWTT
jgi:hypothetical protein